MTRHRHMEKLRKLLWQVERISLAWPEGTLKNEKKWS